MNIDDKLLKTFKSKVSLEGTTMTNVLTTYIKEYVKVKKRIH